MIVYNILYLLEGIAHLLRRPLPKLSVYFVGTSLLFKLSNKMNNRKNIDIIYKYGLLPIHVYNNFPFDKSTLTLFSSTFVHYKIFHFLTGTLT